MKRPNREVHSQSLKDSPPGTPVQRKETERIEAQLGDHEGKTRKLREGQNAGQMVPPKGWLETKRD